MRPGQLAVAVYSSDPEFGDPYEFVFYLEPPYTEQQLDVKRRDMERAWVNKQQERGLECRSAIEIVGPVGFFDDERFDRDEKHRGDDEYQLKAWFRRKSPLIVPADVIDMWSELRRRNGHPVNEPVPAGRPMQPGAFSKSSDPFRE